MFFMPSKYSPAPTEFPYVPQSSIKMAFQLLCSFAKSFNGTEQIQCYQRAPKIIVNYNFLVKNTEAESLISALYRPVSYLVPLWYQMDAVQVSVNSGDTKMDIPQLGRFYKFCTHVFLYCSASEDKEYIEIESIVGDTVNFAYPALNNYPIGSIVSPAFPSVVCDEPSSDEYPEDGLVEIKCSFLIEHRLGMIYSFSYKPIYHNSKMVLVSSNDFDNNTSPNTYATDFENIDLNAGFVRNFIKYKTPPIVKYWGFSLNNYTEISDLVNLFVYLKGRQRLVYVPTLRNEFKIIDYVAVGEINIMVKSSGLRRIFENSFGSRSILFSTIDGIFTRDILSISDYDEDTEMITLSSGTQYELFPDVSHICWMILSRSDSDEFSIEQKTLKNGFCSINFVEVKNE